MIEVKFTGDPEGIGEEMINFLKRNHPDTKGAPSTTLNAPENVTRAVLYEPVRSQANHNEYYIVTVVNDQLPIACTCKDFHYSIRKKRERGDRMPVHTCKHMQMARVRHRKF